MSTVTKMTVADLDRLIEQGAFARPDSPRVELIHGELATMMSPASPLHENVIARLTQWSYRRVDDDRIHVRVQLSLSEPNHDSLVEPDIAWVKVRDYSKVRPVGADALLIIEVAGETLRKDLGEKAQLYAAAGIADYWVVDLKAQVIHVHREPSDAGYASITRSGIGASLAPLVDPNHPLPVASLFAN